MNTNIVEIGAFKPDSMPLTECLEELAKYGRPQIGQWGDKGWHCSVKVFVTGEGVEFDVKTSFNIKTPEEAANICYQRLAKALQQIKDTK